MCKKRYCDSILITTIVMRISVQELRLHRSLQSAKRQCTDAICSVGDSQDVASVAVRWDAESGPQNPNSCRTENMSYHEKQNNSHKHTDSELSPWTMTSHSAIKSFWNVMSMSAFGGLNGGPYLEGEMGNHAHQPHTRCKEDGEST